MKTLNKLGLICGLIGIFTFAAPASAADQFANEWRIAVAGNAGSAGSINFKLTFEPENDGSVRSPITVDTAVAANSGGDDIVGLIGDSFSNALSESDFNVEISWGENVRIEAGDDTPNFALSVTNNTLQDVSINIKD